MEFSESNVIKLQHQMKERPQQQNWGDEQFAELASQLYSKARMNSHSKATLGAQELVAYFMLVLTDWGSGAAEIELRRLAGTDCDKGDLATAFVSACHAGSEYEVATRGLAWLRDQVGLHEIVAIRLAQAYAGTGRTDELKTLATEFISGVQFGSWAAEQWARILLGCGLWDSAVRFIEKIDSNLDLRSQYSMRAESFEGEAQFPYPSRFIGLEAEQRKTELTDKVLSFGGISAQNIKGVDARDLPANALSILSGKVSNGRNVTPGAIGCALSHMKVLEDVARSDFEICLVMEDDSAPFIHWSFLAAPIEQAANYDLVFVNQRMSFVNRGKIPEIAELLPTWQVLGERPFDSGGVGTDGYLVTPKGARKLLQFLALDGVQGHIDWQIAAYACSGEGHKSDVTTLSQEKVLASGEFLHKGHSINAACFSVPLICESSHGASTVKEVSKQVNDRGI